MIIPVDHIREEVGVRGGLVVSALDFRSSGLGSSTGWGHCVVFLDKTLCKLDRSDQRLPPSILSPVPAAHLDSWVERGTVMQWQIQTFP